MFAASLRQQRTRWATSLGQSAKDGTCGQEKEFFMNEGGRIAERVSSHLALNINENCWSGKEKEDRSEASPSSTLSPVKINITKVLKRRWKDCSGKAGHCQDTTGPVSISVTGYRLSI